MGRSITQTDNGIAYAEASPSNAPAGEDKRPVVVCLHGIGGDEQSFAPQLEHLPRSLRVIAWCMPGYGGSRPLESVTFDTLVAALEDFRRDLGCTSFHLVGQSIGGMIAQQYAHRFPGRVRSLCLIATTSAFGGRDDSFKDAFLAARLKPLDEGTTMSALALAFVPEITGPGASQDCLSSATRSMAAVPPETYRQILRCLVTFDQREAWPTLEVPCCLIAGAVDNNAPARTMQKMAARNPNAEFHEIENAGHLVNLEMPQATNEILTTFLHSIETQINPSNPSTKENS